MCLVLMLAVYLVLSTFVFFVFIPRQANGEDRRSLQCLLMASKACSTTVLMTAVSWIGMYTQACMKRDTQSVQMSIMKYLATYGNTEVVAHPGLSLFQFIIFYASTMFHHVVDHDPLGLCLLVLTIAYLYELIITDRTRKQSSTRNLGCQRQQ